MNLSVIISLLLSKYVANVYFDPAFACLISLIMLKNAIGIGKEASAILMDEELSESDRHTIEVLVKSHPLSKSIHDLRTRKSGNKTFIEFHLELDGNLPLSKAHDVTEDLEKEIYKLFPDSDVTIHQEPYGIDDYRNDTQINNASA
jgi:ferrous-iron efflux pump FieF